MGYVLGGGYRPVTLQLNVRVSILLQRCCISAKQRRVLAGFVLLKNSFELVFSIHLTYP